MRLCNLLPVTENGSVGGGVGNRALAALREVQPEGVSYLEFTDAELAEIRLALESMAECALPRWDYFASQLVRAVLDEGATLFKEGDSWPYMGMVVRGYVELRTADDKGDSWVMSIAEPGQLVASPPALLPRGMTTMLGLFPSYSQIRQEFERGHTIHSARAITDAGIVVVPYATLEDLAETETEWASMLMRQTMLFAAGKELRHREFLTLSPLDRYLRFERDRGHLLSLLPKRSVASLLGITPESLSRILARLAQRRDEV